MNKIRYLGDLNKVCWNRILLGEDHLCVRFQLGNSFGNTKMKREVYLYIHFQLGNSFGNIKVKRDIHLYAFN